MAVRLLCLLLLAATAASQELDPDRTALLDLHARILAAHREGDIEDWMQLEAEDFVSANGGVISFPTLDERRAMRAPYLQSTSFSTYVDLREPVVRLSDDGSLGWLIAEVQIVGTRTTDEGSESFEQQWSWIELYEKREGTWLLVGNVSNRRP